MLGVVGLTDVAGKRTRGFSLGMRQRLGIAAALLGDPKILMFDEPVNGLDPEGILWIRNLMRSLAATAAGASVSAAGAERELEIRGLTEDQVSDLAFAHGIRLYHLAATRVSLEHAFMELTAGNVEYRAGLPA